MTVASTGRIPHVLEDLAANTAVVQLHVQLVSDIASSGHLPEQYAEVRTYAVSVGIGRSAKPRAVLDVEVGIVPAGQRSGQRIVERLWIRNGNNSGYRTTGNARVLTPDGHHRIVSHFREDRNECKIDVWTSHTSKRSVPHVLTGLCTQSQCVPRSRKYRIARILPIGEAGVDSISSVTWGIISDGAIIGVLHLVEYVHDLAPRETAAQECCDHHE